jgi:hypothetical protein
MVKKEIKKLVGCLLAVIVVLSSSGITASAEEFNSVDGNGIIVLDDINDVSNYNGVDGTYVQYLNDGSIIEVTISTSDIKSSGINGRSAANLSSTEYVQNKSYLYQLKKANGDLNWSSEVIGTFHYNNTYVWCTAGTAYHSFGDSSSTISYSKNTYSSSQVTGVSKYEIAAKITTPSGTYNISQYVGCNPAGTISQNMSY